MTLRDFEKCVEFNIKNNIKHAILGLGAPGIGKSEIIKQIGDKYGYKVIDIRLSQMSEVEIGGLIFPNEDKTKTRWLTPEILPDEKRDGKKTILLLDEITSCTKRVQVAAYQLILDRRIGEYTLPEGTFVIALGNREEDNGVYVELAGPLADRFEIHNIDIDFNTWKHEYALKNGVHAYVIKYLTSKPSALHTQSTSRDEMVFATPRSWVRVSDILKYNSDVSDSVIRNKIIGNIGYAEGTQFIKFCESDNCKVTAQDLLNGCAGPTDVEKSLALIDGLLGKMCFVKKYNDLSELSASDKEMLEKVIEAFFRLPNHEYAVLGIRKALDMNRDVVKQMLLQMNNPKIAAFFKANQSK